MYGVAAFNTGSSFACGVLLSENLQHGWTVDGLRLENPFRHLVGDFG